MIVTLNHVKRQVGVQLLLLGLCAIAPTMSLAADPRASTSAETTTTVVVNNPGSGTNRIEITGNSVHNTTVDCGAGVTNINSVSVDGKSLKGKTIIVQGRNVRDVRSERPCPDNQRPANINSVNIQ
jgi:hypothetical protein